METNLIYVFLNDVASKCNNRLISPYVYKTVPDYYYKTFNYNKQKFTASHFISSNENIDELLDDEDFKYIDKLFDEKWSKNKRDPFWYNTLVRVLLLCIYVRKYNLKNVIHVEADNIIFGEDIESICNIFNPGQFGYSCERSNAGAPSFIFIKDENAADSLLKQHIKLFEKGEQVLNPYVGHFYNNIMDMAFLDLIRRGGKNYKMLPCLPYGPFSENFSALNCVFDPTSYGQFLGGTNNGHSPGFIDSAHYIGQELLKNAIKVSMYENKPVIDFNNTIIPIFNLHVHNKHAIDKFI